jgi:hypothetical protein
MKAEITRRRFIRTLGATASATLVSPSLFDFGTVFAQTKPFERKNVKNLTEDSQILKSYAKAIKAMRALGVDKQLSWCYQAAIHGRPGAGATFEGTCGKGGAMDAWRTCQHYNSWFLPWHRMYIYWFERIVRKMSGDESWALPYWDWENDKALPKPFQQGTALTELFIKGRNKTLNDGTATVWEIGRPEDFKKLVTDANANKVFDPGTSPDFSDLLERGPHDLIHSRLGSAPTTDGSIGLMGRTSTTAEDPIFFLHHANIDRLWCRWLLLKDGRTDPLGNKAWGRDRKFTFFDENGVKKDMEASCSYVYPKVQLNYVYEGDDQVPEKCTVDYVLSCTVTEDILIYEAIETPTPPFVLPRTSDPVYFTFTVDSQFREKVINILNDPTKTVYLNLTDISTPTQPDVAWDIFLGPGAGPSLTAPFFVGAMGLFGGGVQDEQIEHFMPGGYTCAVNTALLEWLQLGLNVKMNVTFQPAGVVVDGQQTHPVPASEVTIGHAQLIVQTVICS